MTTMRDLTPDDLDCVSKEEFVAMARRILESRNTGNFSDDWVGIRTNYNGLDLQITRQAQFVSPDEKKPRNEHLRVSNPTTMVLNGEIIRHHPEHAYIVKHMRSLLEGE